MNTPQRSDAVSVAANEPTGELQQRARIARRQYAGGFSFKPAPRAANDNEAATDHRSWPLAAQLKRDGNEALLPVAERYRAVYDAAQYEPRVSGSDFGDNDEYSLDQRVQMNDDGSVENKGIRRHGAGTKTPANDNGPHEKKNPVTFPPRYASLARRQWNGDAGLIAHIDGSRMLHRLRVALGPLLEPFEDAVLHGETLTALGERRGVNKVAAGATGRALVMMGLEAVQRCFAEIDRETV